MINIPHIDLKIWDPEFKVIEIIHSLQTFGNATISLDGEGSDCNTLGLYKILDTICNQFGFDPKNISILTNNQLEHHPVYNIKKSAPLYIDSGQKFATKNTIPSKDLDNLKHFGVFISRSTWQRLLVGSFIWNNFREVTEMTYHYSYNDDYHKQHLGVDTLVNKIGSKHTVEAIKNFLPALPLRNDAVNSYPILTPTHFAISKLYSNFFVEIVCETFLAGNSFYPTEKIWRPIICRTPFIVLGPANFLSNLQKLGFKTFDRWWDESYDIDAAYDDGLVAIDAIQRIIQQLSLLSREELEGILIDMESVLDHNYKTFMNLTTADFRKVWP